MTNDLKRMVIKIIYLINMILHVLDRCKVLDKIIKL